MKIAVRYLSRSGNTKAVAESIAEEVGVDAVSVDQPQSAIEEPVDVLFIGGALYAYGIDGRLKDYLKTLKKENVKKAAVFSTSWISKHAVDLIKKGLTENGIAVADDFFYVKNKPNEKELQSAKDFAKKQL